MKCSLDVMKCSVSCQSRLPDLLDVGLLSLPADCPGGQQKFQAEQRQDKQAHFKNWELIGHDFTSEGLSADLPAHHRNRKSDQQDSQGGKGRIAEPFANVHPTQLHSSQADGAQDANIPPHNRSISGGVSPPP